MTTFDPALKKIVHVVGTEKAQSLTDEILRRIGKTAVETPDDLYRFAVEIMKKGGVLQAVGRSIKIQAILLGAHEE